MNESRQICQYHGYSGTVGAKGFRPPASFFRFRSTLFGLIGLSSHPGASSPEVSTTTDLIRPWRGRKASTMTGNQRLGMHFLSHFLFRPLLICGSGRLDDTKMVPRAQNHQAKVF
jgi:hypothetical protein